MSETTPVLAVGLSGALDPVDTEHLSHGAARRSLHVLLMSELRKGGRDEPLSLQAARILRVLLERGENELREILGVSWTSLEAPLGPDAGSER